MDGGKALVALEWMEGGKELVVLEWMEGGKALVALGLAYHAAPVTAVN